jgi:serine/threonine protein kinase
LIRYRRRYQPPYDRQQAGTLTAHLGSGGFGDVYRATDSKLGRSVAIKLLPEAFARDAEGVARFQRDLINTVLDDAASPITLLLNWKPPAQ